jgi:hypothetical protein
VWQRIAVIQTQFTSYDQDDLLADPLTIIMTDGGDERILIDPATGLNRYLTVPRPQTMIAYSSSTANFISVPAMAEVRRRVLEFAPGFVLEPDGITGLAIVPAVIVSGDLGDHGVVGAPVDDGRCGFGRHWCHQDLPV